MLSGRDDLGESRMREICMSGSTREREAAVFGLCASHSVLSSLLYWLRKIPPAALPTSSPSSASRWNTSPCSHPSPTPCPNGLGNGCERRTLPSLNPQPSTLNQPSQALLPFLPTSF